MAKDIQNLPKNTANAVVLATLGWKDISSHLHLVRIMFVWRLLALPCNCLYKCLFIRRCFYILHTGKFNKSSPISLMLLSLNEFDMLRDLKSCISTGILPSKYEWKKKALKNMHDKNFCDWRFEVKLYSKLDIFRQVVLKMYDYVWWDLVKITQNVKSRVLLC